MKRCLATVTIFALCLAPLHADVTMVQTLAFEGGVAAMMGGMPGGTPTLTTRVKGTKARVDVDIMNNKFTTLTDTTTKQVTVLNSADKTAVIYDLSTLPAPAAASAPPPDAPPVNIDAAFKPTGKSRTLEGVNCDDHEFTISIGLGEMGGAQQGQAAEMMKDVKMVMNGTSCVAKAGPGADEMIAFQKAAAAQGTEAILRGALPGQRVQGLDKLMAAMSSAPGIAYLTEIVMSFESPSPNPVVDMLKQMGAMKMTQRTTKVSTEPIGDDVFAVPADYKVEKK